MTTILQFAASLQRDRSGATAIEYGLIAALIVVALLVGLHQFAGETTTMWGTVDTAITAG